jgi:hypothetical protein
MDPELLAESFERLLFLDERREGALLLDERREEAEAEAGGGACGSPAGAILNKFTLAFSFFSFWILVVLMLLSSLLLLLLDSDIMVLTTWTLLSE